jgi:putative endonuclease
LAKEPVYSVYMIDCDGTRIYTGIATDVQRRWREHLGLQPGGARFTRAGGRLDLVYQVAAGSRSEASRIEARIKKLSRLKKLAIVASQPNLVGLFGFLGLDREEA